MISWLFLFLIISTVYDQPLAALSLFLSQRSAKYHHTNQCEAGPVLYKRCISSWGFSLAFDGFPSKISRVARDSAYDLDSRGVVPEQVGTRARPASLIITWKQSMVM